MNSTDYIIMGVVSISVVFSVVRGFLKEAISLIAWIAAFWLAFKYISVGAGYLEGRVASANLRLGISFCVIFLFVLLVGGIINYFFAKFVKKTGLSAIDRFLGVFFGLTRGLVVVSLALLLLSVSPASHEPWWRDSVLVPCFAPLSKWLKELSPNLGVLKVP